MSRDTVAAAPRLLHRQRVLLSLLRAFGGEIGERDFQRLLFDYGRLCRDRGMDAPYDFVILERGLRSFTAVADRDRLAHRGIVESGTWRLTTVGRRLAKTFKNRDVAVFAARRQRLGYRAETDGNGPTPVGGHFCSEAGKDNDSPNGGLLATIGYERRSYEAYFNQLLRTRISRLCDVRHNPLSRKWGFSKRLLSQGCEELGIRYESFPELGIDSEHRASLSDRTAYGRLFARYEATILPRHHTAVAKIAGWVDAGERVAISCYERDSRDCHRSRLATAIVKTVAKPMRPRHL